MKHAGFLQESCPELFEGTQHNNLASNTTLRTSSELDDTSVQSFYESLSSTDPYRWEDLGDPAETPGQQPKAFTAGELQETCSSGEELTLALAEPPSDPTWTCFGYEEEPNINRSGAECTLIPEKFTYIEGDKENSDICSGAATWEYSQVVGNLQAQNSYPSLSELPFHILSNIDTLEDPWIEAHPTSQKDHCEKRYEKSNTTSDRKRLRQRFSPYPPRVRSLDE